jgi:hypothetical protein
MNKQILKIKQNFVLCLVMLSLLALSCNRADMEEGHIGKSGFLVTLTDDVRVESRSTPAELEDPLNTDFDLKIIRTSTGETVYDGKFKEDLIQASAGFYQVTASFGTNPVLEVDAPYYEGTVTEVEVRKDTPAQVLVPCKVANALLSVVYGESIAKVYDSYYVTVAVGEESREIRDNESAYFRAGSVVNVWFHGTPKGESEERTFELLHEGLTVPLEAGEHAILNLSIEADVSVSVEKVEVKKVTVGETVPVEYMPKPKLEAEGFSNNELTFAETEKKAASVHLKLASPLQELKMRFHFEDAQFASLNDQDYLLSKDKAALENALGITLPDVNATDATIDFSNLIAKMQTNAGATTRNVIELDAQANNRWSSDKETDASSRKLTLNCNKPVFSVSAYPGNIWTKEFTVNHLLAEDVESGDYETLGEKMTYQFSSNGTDGWTDLGEDLRKADLTPGTIYYIRGLYRGVIESKVTEIATCPIIEIPNGNMESWRTLTKKVMPGANFFKKVTITADYPDNNIWSCVNVKTFESTPNIESTYNMIASTYKETGRSGYAAALRTVGWDNGSGNTTSIIYHVSAGKLFLGTYSFNHDNNSEVYNYGIEYKSRPTHLRFFYKYAPYNNDSFKVIVVLENRSEGIVTRVGQVEFVSNETKSDFTELSLPIEYINMELPITHMYVLFSSSAGCSDSEAEETNNLKGMVSGGDYHQGSVFIIDDVELQYLK